LTLKLKSLELDGRFPSMFMGYKAILRRPKAANTLK
jgi:hypothetical protein